MSTSATRLSVNLGKTVKTKRIGLENIFRLDMGVVSYCSTMKGLGEGR